MPLLLEEDYKRLEDYQLSYEECEQERFFIFTQLVLPEIYTVKTCDILVCIPLNYNQDGNDMFWTYPVLQRIDGIAIPATNSPGMGDNRIWSNKEFCRWSRHWQQVENRWRPGKDDIISIYKRIDWALKRPDAA